MSEICDKLRAVMPKDGEPHGDAAHAYLHALNRCIELAAAASAERIFLAGDPVPSVSDIEHMIQYVSLTCRTPQTRAAWAERFAADNVTRTT